MTIVLVAYEGLFEFKQGSTETLGQAMERFKRILRGLIGNRVENVVQLQYFYFGLDEDSKTHFDVISEGRIWTKTTWEIIVLLEKVSSNYSA